MNGQYVFLLQRPFQYRIKLQVFGLTAREEKNTAERNEPFSEQFNKLTSVFHASVLLLIKNFVHNIVKVAVDRRVDPETTLTVV